MSSLAKHTSAGHVLTGLQCSIMCPSFHLSAQREPLCSTCSWYYESALNYPVSVVHVLPENVLTCEVAQCSPITLNKVKSFRLSIPLQKQNQKKKSVLQRSQLTHIYWHKCFLKMTFSKSWDDFFEERRPIIHAFLWSSLVPILQTSPWVLTITSTIF